MSNYPWIKDSQYGTTPLETGYLEVTSTNGLYLNSTTSGTNSNAILMKGFITGGSTPVTCYYYCDKLRYYPNVWGGETFLSQDMLRFADSANTTLSQLNLSGLSCYNPGVNTYFQSSNNGQYQSIGSSGEEIFISSNSGSGNVYFSAANLYLNGTPIRGGGGVTDIQAGSGISVNQNTGSVTITNTGGGGGGVTDIQAGPGISVNQTTGSVTITNTGGGGSYGIDYLQAGSGIYVSQISIGPNVWQIDNTGGGGGGVTDIQAGTGISVNQTTGSVTITNTSAGKPSYTFDLYNIACGSSGQVYAGSTIFIPKGTYQITYGIQFDSGMSQSAGYFYMFKAYCFLVNTSGSQYYYPQTQNAYNLKPSGLMSYNSSNYPNAISYTDNIIISSDETFYLGAGQENELGLYCNMYLSATLVLQ
jgi:hypothetical protein